MRYIALIIIAFGLFASHARAQSGVEVEAEIEPERTYLGSTFTYTVRVRSVGQADVENPRLDLPDSINMHSTGTRFLSRPGRVREADGTTRIATVVVQTFTYTLSADRVGSITIPPASIVIDSVEYKTNPVTVEIIEPESLDGFEFEARLAKSRVYVGEPVILKLTWFAGSDVRGFALGSGDLPDELEAEPINDPAAYRDRSGQFVRAELFDELVFGRVQRSSRRGRPVLMVTFEIQLRPTVPGTYTLGPVAAVFDTPDPESFSLKRGISRTDPVELEVRPLPTEGRPVDFGGLIGTYRLEAAAEPTSVSVGDPISVRISITGTDPLAVQTGPRLDLDPAFTEAFKLDPGGWQRQQTGREEAVFHTTIRALSDQVEAIPPIRLPYFDADAGEYRLAESEPIPLTVRPAGTVTLADAVTSSVLTPAAREKLGTPSAGLWSIASTPDLVAAADPTDLRMVLYALLVVPPVLLIGHVASGLIRQRMDSPAAHHRRAFRQARRFARRGKPEQAVRTLLASQLGLCPEAVSAADCRRATQDAALAEELAGWLTWRESFRFGGPEAPPPSDTRRVLELLRTVYRSSEVRR